MTLTAISAIGSQQASGQEINETSNFEKTETEYFEIRNLQDTRSQLRQLALENIPKSFKSGKGRRRGKGTRNYRREAADKWSRELTLNGVTASDLEKMRESGFDLAVLVDALDNGKQLDKHGDDLAQQRTQTNALLHDLIIIGTIESAERTAEPDDGYVTTFEIRIDQKLKGNDPGSTVAVRQDAGRSRGKITEVRRNPSVVEGRQYLLYLSKGMYDFKRTMHRVNEGEPLRKSIQKSERVSRYSLEMASRMKDGILVGLDGARENAMQPQAIPKSTDSLFSYIKEIDTITRKNR